jgi:serine/threonine protein kinase
MTSPQRNAATTLEHIPFDFIEVGECVGVGTFKTVFEGELEGRKVAVLKMRKKESVDEEAKLMVELGQHPRLATFFGKTTDQDGDDCLISGLFPPNLCLLSFFMYLLLYFSCNCCVAANFLHVESIPSFSLSPSLSPSLSLSLSLFLSSFASLLLCFNLFQLI